MIRALFLLGITAAGLTWAVILVDLAVLFWDQQQSSLLVHLINHPSPWPKVLAGLWLVIVTILMNLLED